MLGVTVRPEPFFKEILVGGDPQRQAITSISRAKDRGGSSALKAFLRNG